MGRWQSAQRPRKTSQPRTGILWYHRIGWPHCGQCEAGRERLIPRGIRQTTTLLKLPIQAPRNVNQSKNNQISGSKLISLLPKNWYLFVPIPFYIEVRFYVKNRFQWVSNPIFSAQRNEPHHGRRKTSFKTKIRATLWRS